MMHDQTAETDALDPNLEGLFRQTHVQIPEGSFLTGTLQRVRKAEARRRFFRRLAYGMGLIAIVAASPWLIDASVRLSTLLDEGLALVSAWLATPAGIAVGLVAMLAVAALRPLAAAILPFLRLPFSRRR